MYSNISEKIKKIFMSFVKLNKITKNIIKYGTLISLALIVLGTILIYVNRSGHFDVNLDFAATSLVKVSFTLMAEAIIGGILVDYISCKN
jgi:uncharacterized membrane protein